MRLIIPTYGRASIDRQHTLRALKSAGFSPTLVVQAREADQYRMPAELAVLPDNIRTIGPTRDWIMENFSDEKLMLMDDDLAFAKRRFDDPQKFLACTPDDIVDLVMKIEDALDDYDHVGVAGREGANRITKPFRLVERMMRVLAYNRSVYFEVGAKFADIPLMEDFHMILSWLRAGAPNYIINSYVQDQIGGANATGGCSTYRTDQLQTLAAHKLAQLHPGFVTVMEKTTKVAWGGGTRTDVRVSWKAAYASSPDN